MDRREAVACPAPVRLRPVAVFDHYSHIEYCLPTLLLCKQEVLGTIPQDPYGYARRCSISTLGALTHYEQFCLHVLLHCCPRPLRPRCATLLAEGAPVRALNDKASSHQINLGFCRLTKPGAGPSTISSLGLRFRRSQGRVTPLADCYVLLTSLFQFSFSPRRPPSSILVASPLFPPSPHKRGSSLIIYSPKPHNQKKKTKKKKKKPCALSLAFCLDESPRPRTSRARGERERGRQGGPGLHTLIPFHTQADRSIPNNQTKPVKMVSFENPLKFGTDLWDPSHRFETSWLLPPYALAAVRATFVRCLFPPCPQCLSLSLSLPVSLGFVI